VWEDFQIVCLAEKKEGEFLKHVTVINRNGIEWVDKCKIGIYYGEERIANVYSSFDIPAVRLCWRMCVALFMAVLGSELV